MFARFRRARSPKAESEPDEPRSPTAEGRRGSMSMLSAIRRASLSMGSLRGSPTLELPPVEKRRSRVSISRSKGPNKRVSRTSRLSLKVEPLMEPHVKHANLVIQQALYRRGDPFKNLSSHWLQGGDKGELPSESSEEELLEGHVRKRKKGKAEVSATEVADFITGLRRNMKRPETQAQACEELSQRLAGRSAEGIEPVIIEEAAAMALEAAQEHPDDMALHVAVSPLLSNLLNFTKSSGGYPTSVIAQGAALTLHSYIRFHEKLEGADNPFEKVWKRLAKELPIEDQLEIMNSAGDALPDFCGKMYKKASRKKFEQEEVVRRQQLKKSAFGHLTWLRGHKLSADFQPTWQVKQLRIQEKRRTYVQKGPPEVGGDVWYKVWVPNSQKEWCYKGSFVNEVRFLAESQGMELFWMNVETARQMFQKDPRAVREAVKYHVVAVSTDDKRYLWSHSFVQFLTVLQEESDFPYGQVCYTPEDFHERYPKALFPVPGKYHKIPKPKAMTMPVPVAVSRRLRANTTMARDSYLASDDRDKPAPPPLPDRLPCPIPYELSEPWMCIFASDMEKRDLGKLLEIQQSHIERKRETVVQIAEEDTEAEEASEQPEEEELEEDEVVEPLEDEPDEDLEEQEERDEVDEEEEPQEEVLEEEPRDSPGLDSQVSQTRKVRISEIAEEEPPRRQSKE